MIALLERLIEERAEYTHWMSQKSTDEESRTKTETHLHYIKVLKETKAILAERMEPETAVGIQTESPHAEPTNKPSRTDNNNTHHKRKLSSTALHGTDRQKAAKMEATTPKPVPLFKGARPAPPSAATEKTQQTEWRQIVAKNCNSTTDNRWATAKKPMSYAAAARAIAA